MKQNILAFFIFGFFVVPPVFAAGIPVVDAPNTVQNTITAFEAVSQGLKQIQQYQTQLLQFESDLKNLAAPSAYIWDQTLQIRNKLEYMQRMVDYYSDPNTLQRYLEQFQDINYYRSSPCFQLGGCTQEQWIEMERRREEIKSAEMGGNKEEIENLGKVIERLSTKDLEKLDKLSASATSAGGNLEALAALSQIAHQQNVQLLQIHSFLAQERLRVLNERQEQLDFENRQKEINKMIWSSGTHKPNPNGTISQPSPNTGYNFEHSPSFNRNFRSIR